MLRAMVERPALVRSLAHADAFVVVIAGPGYGKTTLLRQWDASDPRPFLWSTSTPGSATGSASAEILDAAYVRWGAATEPPHGSAAVGVVRLLENPPEPFVLVLDDAQHLDQDDELLQRVLDASLSGGVQLVLVGRSLERRAVSRLRLRGGLVAIGEDRLAFDVAEAGQLLGEDWDRADLEELMTRTEGWVAGLRLARVAADQGREPSQRFSGGELLVRDYLHSELLSDLDPEVAAFLQSASEFDVLTGALCDAALERHDSHRMLEQLSREHLLVAPLDRDGRSFRMHPMLREALRIEAILDDPAAVARHRAAGAQWLAGQGLASEALRLRLANGERSDALALLADVVLPLFSDGKLAQLVELIHGIGSDVAVDSGYLATMFAYAGMMTGDDVCAQRWGRAARSWYASHRFTAPDEEVAFLTFRAHLGTDGVHAMREDAEQARVIAPESSQWRAPTVMLCGIASALCGDLPAAKRDLDEAIHLGRETGVHPATILSLAERALIADHEADSATARRMLADFSELVESSSMSTYPQATPGHALHALYAARDGRRAQATAFLAAANGLRGSVGSALPWLGVQVRITIARAATLLGDVAMARAALREAEALIALLPDAQTLRADWLAVERALVPLGVGSTSGASLLTSAELRVLAVLPSHLSFEEIGGRLHVSKNTVKSHAMSVYRKLGVSSRSEAVQHARDLGLVEA